MAIRVYHQFQSAKSDSGDSSLVNASDWNADHSLSMAADRLLGNPGNVRGPVSELQVYPASRLAAGALNVAKRTASLLAHDVFTANGTWNKHADAQLILVQVIGGGASGNTGLSAASGSAPGGGGAGGAGICYMMWFLPTDLPSSVSVTVGAQRNGPAGVVNSIAGGARGNLSSFGNYIVAPGGEWNGSWNYQYVAYWQNGIRRYPGSGNPDAGGMPHAPFSPAGGGWGGGLDGSNNLQNNDQSGGAGYGGGQSNFELAVSTTLRYATATGGNGGARGATAGTAGGDGTSRTGTSAWFGCGDGGGGGQASSSARGGNGGAGGAPGGGGGGGGGCLNTHASGDGGHGARGEVRVLQWG